MPDADESSTDDKPPMNVAVASARAVDLLMRGEIKAGIPAYRQCLRAGRGAPLPIGMHIAMLEGAGRADAGDALRRLALRGHRDISRSAGGLGATDAAAAAEYEASFDRGIVNSEMIVAYMTRLVRLGRIDEVAAILAPEALLQDMPLLDDMSANGALADAVASFLQRREARVTGRKVPDLVTGMVRVETLERSTDPAIVALFAACRRRVESYCTAWVQRRPPFARYLEERTELSGWGQISRATGHVAPHIHHQGLVTAVYYPADLPAGIGGGDLRVVAAADGDANGDTVSIRPERGRIVLMPAFYRHWTEPLQSDGLRIAVTIEAINPLPADPSLD